MLNKLYISIIIIICLEGCASLEITQTELDSKPEGIRVYQPAVYLIVLKNKDDSIDNHLIYMPDYNNAYDIKPRTVFAKQDFKVEVTAEGLLKSVSANQDTTAFLTFLKQAGELGTKAAGRPVSSQVMKGNIGLDPGIYKLSKEGKFVLVNSTHK